MRRVRIASSIRSAACDGFTLLEMMLAVGVLGLMLAMLAESFHTIAGSKIHGEGRLYADREGRAILWEMSNEIRNSVQTPVSPSHVALLGSGRGSGGAYADSIVVSTLAAGHRRSISGFGPENLVSYNVISNPNHPGWMLLTRMQQSALLSSDVAERPIVVADNLLSLHLKYFDGNAWRESWNSSQLGPPHQLPIAAAIELKMAAPGGHELDFATQVVIPMAIPQW
jgi:prepilin-type N-terminal cleavage/methylation domain-containing protein